VTPSAEDVRRTAQLVKAGALLGIAVLDHVIVAGGSIDGSRPGCVSMRETGVCSFKT